MIESGRVGAVAKVLGFAGLLPQMAAIGLMLLGRHDPTDLGLRLVVGGHVLAIAYGGLIVSFIGGIWWGYAMRRRDRQAPIAIAAVAPSLIALAAAAAAVGNLPGMPAPWPAIVLGSAIILTLVVDQHLVATGEAPEGWMNLRVPLSLGLGVLTISAGVLIAV